MADGINIKLLPAATSMQGGDRLLIDRNITGTLVIPFSSVVVDNTQVSFYNDFSNLSAYTYALSASTNASFIQAEQNLATNIAFLSTEIVTVSTNVFRLSSSVISLSTNTTTFISGGISPSGSIVPAKVGILYFAANTKDYFVSVDNVNNTDWKRILTVDY